MTEHIFISKLDAAKRQLEIAIKLFLSNGDIVSIHTLAAASHTILRDLCNKQDKQSYLKDAMVEIIRPEKQKEFRKMINKAENFFKHADTDPDKILEFHPEETEWFLWDVCAMYKQLTTEKTSLISIYEAWFISKHPKIFADEKFVQFLENEIQQLKMDHRNRVQFLDLLPEIEKFR